ncbi:hypothetical protein SLA2020_431890 [Shorea laevis]
MSTLKNREKYQIALYQIASGGFKPWDFELFKLDPAVHVAPCHNELDSGALSVSMLEPHHSLSPLPFVVCAQRQFLFSQCCFALIRPLEFRPTTLATFSFSRCSVGMCEEACDVVEWYWVLELMVLKSSISLK